MRSPNRKHKPKHMTKVKYRRVELDWVLVYQKNSKKISVKPKMDSYEQYEKENLLSWEYDDYKLWHSKCGHVKYKRYGIVYTYKNRSDLKWE